MKLPLSHIASLLSGVYAQPDVSADTLYLQAVHFDLFGEFNREVKPQLKSDIKIRKHLLQPGDVLFAAKGLNNFAVVYQAEWGRAVASSSFIIMRINTDSVQVVPEYLAWCLTNHTELKKIHKQHGTTIPSISISNLSALELEVPAMEHQHKILAIQQLRNSEKKIVEQLEIQKDYLIKQTLIDAAKL